MNRDLFLEAVSSTALPKSALATLYNVTRPTIYSWLDGGAPKNASLSAHADKVSAALVAAAKRRILPFPASVSPRQRNEHIQRMHDALMKAR